MRILCIYFSPTGTVLKSVIKLARSIPLDCEIICYDFTLPKCREHIPTVRSTDFVIFGVPVYAGRVPNLMLPYIKSIKGNGAKVIPLVVFGGRAYDDSLVELLGILKNNGFNIFAAAALVARHSFSDKIGEGRPNAVDILMVENFGKAIYAKLNGANFDKNGFFRLQSLLENLNKDLVYYRPKRKDGDIIDIRKVKPLTNETCNKCGICTFNCPMGAISIDDPSFVCGICIKCCRCVRDCPKEAKYFNDEGFLYHIKDLQDTVNVNLAKLELFI